MARRLSRSYKRRRQQRAFLILGLVVLTVLVTMFLSRCYEEHAALVRQLELPEGSGGE